MKGVLCDHVTCTIIETGIRGELVLTEYTSLDTMWCHGLMIKFSDTLGWGWFPVYLCDFHCVFYYLNLKRTRIDQHSLNKEKKPYKTLAQLVINMKDVISKKDSKVDILHKSRVYGHSLKLIYLTRTDVQVGIWLASICLFLWMSLFQNHWTSFNQS